jgi:hypothetical protein
MSQATLEMDPDWDLPFLDDLIEDSNEASDDSRSGSSCGSGSGFSRKRQNRSRNTGTNTSSPNTRLKQGKGEMNTPLLSNNQHGKDESDIDDTLGKTDIVAAVGSHSISASVERGYSAPSPNLRESALALCSAFLEKDPSLRLGSRLSSSGSDSRLISSCDFFVDEESEREAILSSPFFSSIDWHRLSCGRMCPPYTPHANVVNAENQANIGTFGAVDVVVGRKGDGAADGRPGGGPTGSGSKQAGGPDSKTKAASNSKHGSGSGSGGELRLRAEDHEKYKGWEFTDPMAFQEECIWYMECEERMGKIGPSREGACCCCVLQ